MTPNERRVSAFLVLLLVGSLIIELGGFVLPVTQTQECYTTSPEEMCVETESGWVVTVPMSTSFINEILPVLDGMSLSHDLSSNSPHWSMCNDMYDQLHGNLRTLIASGSAREYNDANNPSNGFHVNDHSWPHYGFNRGRWGLNGRPGSLAHESAHHVGVHHNSGALNSYNAGDICFDY